MEIQPLGNLALGNRSMRHEADLKTGITPLKDLTGIPVDIGILLRHPWASQDDVSGRTFQHHECNTFLMEASNVTQRFSNDGVYNKFLGAASPLEVEFLK